MVKPRVTPTKISRYKNLPQWLRTLPESAADIDWGKLTYSQLYTIRFMRPDLAGRANREAGKRGLLR